MSIPNGNGLHPEILFWSSAGLSALLEVLICPEGGNTKRGNTDIWQTNLTNELDTAEDERPMVSNVENGNGYSWQKPG